MAALHCNLVTSFSIVAANGPSANHRGVQLGLGCADAKLPDDVWPDDCWTRPFAPPVGEIIRPSRGDRQHLLRLHAQAGRIAETDLNRIVNPAVIRALEQDLIWALIS